MTPALNKPLPEIEALATGGVKFTPHTFLGQAVVLYLINHARLKETEVSDITRKLFHRQMRSFHENEQQRYRINANRLMEVESILGYPECETLVATGEFDSFTLPWENAQFAARCPNATFALIKGADHVAQLEKRADVR